MDREKVIAGLTMLADRKNDNSCEGLKCCKIAEDALELFQSQPQIVRCKDCKYRREIPVLGNIVCVDNSVHSPEWFCADGERKEGR